jgi:hypothetical protein
VEPGEGILTNEEPRWCLSELARETGLDPGLERELGFRDRLGVDPPPGDGGAGREEKRVGSKADAEEHWDAVEAVDAVERGLLPRLIKFVRRRGAIGLDAGTSRELAGGKGAWIGAGGSERGIW